MTSHDDANLVQIAWLRAQLPSAHDHERAVFGWGDDSTLTPSSELRQLIARVRSVQA